MQNTPARTTSSSVPRTILYAFLAITIWKVWFGSVDVLPKAIAQIPDSALQRKQLISAVNRSNELLAQLDQTLKTQTLKVQLTGTDNKSTSKRPGRRP